MGTLRDEEGKWSCLHMEACDTANHLTRMEEKVARAQKEVEQARGRADEAREEVEKARVEFVKKWGREPQCTWFYPS